MYDIEDQDYVQGYASIHQGYTRFMHILNRPSEYTTFNWSSSDSSVVEISQDGVILAKSCGFSIITFTLNHGDQEFSAQMTIQVFEYENENFPTRYIQLTTLGGTEQTIFNDNRKKSIHVNNTRYVSFDVINTVYVSTPFDKTQNYSWISDNDDLATINEQGMITALGQGIVTIQGTYKFNPNYKANIQVAIINDLSDLSITFVSSQNISYVDVGGSLQLNGIEGYLFPINISNFTFSSNNQSIASVSSNGLIEGVYEGMTTITGSHTEIEEIIGSFLVSVFNVYTLELSANRNTIYVNDLPNNATISIIVGPSLLSQQYIWSSSNASIATVNSSGVVTAVSSGVVNIVGVYDSNSSYISSIEIIVEDEQQYLSPFIYQGFTGSYTSPLLKFSLYSDFIVHLVVWVHADGPDPEEYEGQIIFNHLQGYGVTRWDNVNALFSATLTFDENTGEGTIALDYYYSFMTPYIVQIDGSPI